MDDLHARCKSHVLTMPYTSEPCTDRHVSSSRLEEKGKKQEIIITEEEKAQNT